MPLTRRLLLGVALIASCLAASAGLVHDDEPDELSWEHLGSCRHCLAAWTATWAALPDAQRAAVLTEATAAGLLHPQPDTFATILVQGEAFAGDGWQTKVVQGRHCLFGGAGHTSAVASYLLDIPEAGRYRLWLRWWNSPGRHNTIRVRLRPGQTAAFTYGWQDTAQGDLLDYRFGFAEMVRDTLPLDYPADQEGFIWDAAPLWADLPAGTVRLDVSGTIHRGPYASRAIDCLALTRNPSGDIPPEPPDSLPDDPATLVRRFEARQPLPDAAAWTAWCLRPGVIPAHQAPTSLATLWQDFRRGLINRLANSMPASPHEAWLAHRFYVDERWNLVGTPAQVRDYVADLTVRQDASRQRKTHFWQWIEAEDFAVSNGWEIRAKSTASGGQALLADYANGPASAEATFAVPRQGDYRLWVRFAQYREFYNHFELTLYQNEKQVAELRYREPGPTGSFYTFVWQPVAATLDAGECRVVLTKNLGKGPYAYRWVDAFVLTDMADWQPDGADRPVQTSADGAPPPLAEAARHDRFAAWLGPPGQQWDGFSATEWPGVDSEFIDDEQPTVLTAPPGGTASRLLRLTNPGPNFLTVTPTLESGGDWLSWRLAVSQLSKGNGWQPTALLHRHQVTVPPFSTTTLWLTADARSRDPGQLHARLRLGDRVIALRLDVAGADLRTTPMPLVGGWCDPISSPAGYALFADIGLTMLHRVAIPKADLRAHGIRLAVLVLGKPASDQDVHGKVAALRSMGLDYGDWAWVIADEPNQKSYPEWVEAARIIRQADPAVQIWCNPGEIQGSTPEAVTAMAPFIDVFCPYTNHFGNQKDAAYAELLPTIGKTRLIYTTPCFDELAPAAPRHYFGLAKRASDLQRDGWDAFCLRNYYGYVNTAWDDVNAYNPAQAVSIYPGAWGQAISSRNLEAVREAIQQWRQARLPEATADR